MICHHRSLASGFRTAVVALALLAIATTAGYAQSPVDSAARKQSQPSRADRLSSAGGLELTAEQKARLTAITNKHADEAKAIGELLKTDPEAAMKRMAALRTKMQAEVRLVLTPEQRTIFDRNVAEMNAHLPISPR